MAARNNVLFGLMLLVASCSTAPSDDINHAPMELEIPEECKGKTGFCYIEPKNYDKLEKRINAALPPYMKQDYGDRSGDIICEPQYSETNDEENCSYKTINDKAFMYIKKSEDPQQNDTFDLLVQSKFYTQCIRTVKCKEEGVSRAKGGEENHQCFKRILANNSDFTSRCSTTEVERSLSIWSSDKVIRKKFLIPACCSCHVEDSF